MLTRVLMEVSFIDHEYDMELLPSSRAKVLLPGIHGERGFLVNQIEPQPDPS